MRRLVNFLLILVVLGAVGFVLARSGAFGSRERRAPSPATPTPAQAPPRDSLRVSVADRPETLLLHGIQRLLATGSDKLELVPFDPETSWMELAAGELDIVIAPIGDAVMAQARFDCGRFLFVSGSSQGYDTIISPSALESPPKKLGITGGRLGELFAQGKFPEAKVMRADDQAQLVAWLTQGAVEAAVLESAGLKGELAKSGHSLGGTSPEQPLLTVVVLSRTLVEESPQTSARVELLKRTLQQWPIAIGYLNEPPDMLRATFGDEARELGLDLVRLLADYRFLTPVEGRQALLKAQGDGKLTDIQNQLALAKFDNLIAPEWDKTVIVPSALQSLFPAVEVPLASPTLTPELLTPSATPASTPSPAAQASPFLGTHQVAGSAPVMPWPEPKTVRLDNAQPLATALTQSRIGVATSNGFNLYTLEGELAATSNQEGPPVAAVLSDRSRFYVTQQGMLQALDEQANGLWKHSFEGTPGSTPLLTSDRILMTVFFQNQHRLVAVDRQTGLVSWQAALKGAPTGGPAYLATSPPAVILADAAGQLSAWNPENGNPLWSAPLGTAATLPLATFQENVAIAEPSGKITFYSAPDRGPIWTQELATEFAFPPTITDGSVLIVGKDNQVYALDRKSGDIKGKFALESAPSTPITVVENLALLGDEKGHLIALTIQPNLSLAHSQTLAEGAALFGPSFSPSHYAVLSGDGKLFIFPR